MKLEAIASLGVKENPALAALKAAQSVLLLQGPVGPFFDRLSTWLLARGKRVNRVALSGGDFYDCQVIPPIKYTGKLEEWSDFLSAQCVQLNVDTIVLFGQSRIYHQIAISAAKKLGTEVVVLEEGYFRPGYVTMELGGVNGMSSTLDRFSWGGNPEPLKAATDEHPFRSSIYHAGIHYGHMLFKHGCFPHYEHHRHRSPPYYLAYWMYSWFRKFTHQKLDLRKQRNLLASKAIYYFVPLQFEHDAQVKVHSDFTSVKEFLAKVIRSFSLHAPLPCMLVFKEHPHGRGNGGYRSFINQLARSLGIESRVVYLVEGDTPVLVAHSAGVVTINSTVGIRALKASVPLFAFSSAIYSRLGLTFDGCLNNFWTQSSPAPSEMVSQYILSLKNLTQVSACAYASKDVELDWK